MASLAKRISYPELADGITKGTGKVRIVHGTSVKQGGAKVLPLNEDSAKGNKRK